MLVIVPLLCLLLAAVVAGSAYLIRARRRPVRHEDDVLVRRTVTIGVGGASGLLVVLAVLVALGAKNGWLNSQTTNGTVVHSGHTAAPASQGP